ncbi:MAG: hypothetical protein KF900_07455 [Bacteroidetes bacterium]|nr:hypothetical protein [Bacteroidota bacterium]
MCKDESKNEKCCTNEKELLFQMHEQFAQNMNDATNRYITLFIGIVALFGFYGLAYGLATTIINSNDWHVKPNAIYLMAIVVALVLFFLFCMLVYTGYQHRRDQALNHKIREKYVTHHDNFFSAYSGIDKGIFSYQPDYLKIQAYFLFVLKIILLLSVIFLPEISLTTQPNTYDENKTIVKEQTPQQDNTDTASVNRTNKHDEILLSENSHNYVRNISKVFISTTLLFCIIVWLCYYLKYNNLYRNTIAKQLCCCKCENEKSETPKS